MTTPYTDADARFDAEQLGRCGVCGRETSVCGHCKECGLKDRHLRWCSHFVVEHVTTDAETKRTFCLGICQGSLVSLKELHSTPTPGWEDVPQETVDGANWWLQWDGEVERGAFQDKVAS